MSELAISAISVAVDETPSYRPAPDITEPELREIAEVVAALDEIPVERMAVLPDSPEDVASHALAAIGAPANSQPLFLFRSGPDPDPFVAMLSRLVHSADWVSEDYGITHLDELAGVALLALLSWAADPVVGATALVLDQPVFVDTEAPPKSMLAVALRISGAGPLRVLANAEGAVPEAVRADAVHRFNGTGPCDAWVGLHAGLRSGLVGDGDRVLLHTCGGVREGWALLEVGAASAIRLSGSVGDEH
ncbi:MAG TPA: hypothetical protein VGM75_33910 [Pseudonocardiaceae bacterium]